MTKTFIINLAWAATIFVIGIFVWETGRALVRLVGWTKIVAAILVIVAVATVKTTLGW